jgi:hypothetical protein
MRVGDERGRDVGGLRQHSALSEEQPETGPDTRALGRQEASEQGAEERRAVLDPKSRAVASTAVGERPPPAAPYVHLSDASFLETTALSTGPSPDSAFP